MVRSVCLAGFVTLLSMPGIAEARARPGPLIETPARATLVLVDDMMIAEETGAEDWRLSTDAYDRRDDGELRVRVKVRPNRAMGRMSLSF
ncbi:hypothetical protein [Sphingomonas solaris]|uniref:hypothetical protein n=1 Tax=Alterirhizorhabdus solaris TaxID=2529389 RepID=UPI001EF12FD2|nr:hypothetical protein [Sphingomonas solaris]